MSSCPKCALLLELYERTPKLPRDYWVMTEIFVLLHGSDVCHTAWEEAYKQTCRYCGNKEHTVAACPYKGD